MITVLGMVLIFFLIGMGIIKIWMPEAISNESFVKIIFTFGLLTLGAVITSLLTKGTDNNADEKQEG